MQWEHKVTWLIGGSEEIRWRNNFWRNRPQQPKRWMKLQALHLKEYNDKGWELVNVLEREKGQHLYIRYYWRKAKSN